MEDRNLRVKGHATEDLLHLLDGDGSVEEGELVLRDGDTIAVIGGGPAGSFFSYFALKMARMLGKDIQVTIFEPKSFLDRGTAFCNHCGGVVSELMVQNMAVEGIHIPSEVIQRGINSYLLHTQQGEVTIQTPSAEKTIASVSRGTGLKGMFVEGKENFDHYLLQSAVQQGARHVPRAVDRVLFEEGKPVLYSGGEKLLRSELVVGAFGVNSPKIPSFEGMDFKYRHPSVTHTAIAEIPLDPEYISRQFGNTIHLFLLPVKNLKFAAIIPKQSHVTVCMLGRKLTRERTLEFLDHPKVRALFPEGQLDHLCCACLPLLNVRAPTVPFADRVVMVGDSGSTRLYKDGIGAAYYLGKLAAKTAVLNGVGEKNFREHYMPDYRNLVVDNRFGRYLFWFTDLFREYSVLTAAMLGVIREEAQNKDDTEKALSAILWDMFTGNERYRNIFYEAVRPGLVGKMAFSFLKQMAGWKRAR